MELLGVIAILSILIIIAIPNVLSLINKNELRMVEMAKKALKDSAVTYANENTFLQKCANNFEPTSLSSTSTSGCTTLIDVKTLIDEDYFDDDKHYCNTNGKVLVYRYISTTNGNAIDELRAYIDDNTCKIK